MSALFNKPVSEIEKQLRAFYSDIRAFYSGTRAFYSGTLRLRKYPNR